MFSATRTLIGVTAKFRIVFYSGLVLAGLVVNGLGFCIESICCLSLCGW